MQNNKKIKVIIATPLYPPEIGGPSTYVKLLEEGLPKKNIEVKVVKFGDVRHLPKIIRHYVYYRRVLKAARNADVVLALDPVSVGLPAMKAAQKAKKPFVVKIVGDYAWEQGRQRFGVQEPLDIFIKVKQPSFQVRVLQKIQTRVAQNAKRIIVPSLYLKKVVISWGISEDKIDIVYNAISIETFGVVPLAVASLPRPLIVSVGRLVPWKEFDGVIDAVADIGASLAVVGDGPTHSRVPMYAKQKLGARGLFTGALSHADTLAVIKSSDVFVLNSSYEGLSHTLMEATMLGVPIVATDAGGNSEIIENGVNGTLIPVGDTSALVYALRERKPSVPGLTSRFTKEQMLSHTATVIQSCGNIKV